ncbi:hypothetical protein JCM10207_001710 [Rhodosporidiobolus poonsookiae]
MLRSPLRGLRAPVKVLVVALVLLCTYKALPLVLPPAYSGALSSQNTGRDPLIHNFDLAHARDQANWSVPGGAGRDNNRAEDDSPREWAPRGPPPPRRDREIPHAEPALPQRPPVPQPAVPPPPPRFVPAPAAARANGEGERRGTYEDELRAVEFRRDEQRRKLREWDARVARAEAEARGESVDDAPDPAGGAQAGKMERRPKNAAARKGKKRPTAGDDGPPAAPARKPAAVAAKKKGPLIQVGGAQHAAGHDAEERVAVANAAAAEKERGKGGKDQWRGKGWDQRFRKQAAEEDAAEADKVEERAVDESERPADTEAAPEPPSLLEHQLVRRFASFDFSSTLQQSASGGPLVLDPNLEDSFQAGADAEKAAPSDGLAKVELTICALVPNEQRFLEEWLLYHRLLGVERFALYDTSHPGAFGAAEVDALADKMTREGGAGDLGPTVEELKAQAGTMDAGTDGLDEKGTIKPERIEGMERWIEQGAIKHHWMRFEDKDESRSFLQTMLRHCTSTYGASTNWLAYLDVDEFLSVSSELYGASEPYLSSPSSSSPTSSSDETDDADADSAAGGSSSAPSAWQYPLHDLLARPQLADAACIPLPELGFRNFGVRELRKEQGVLEVQTHRDVLRQGKKLVREEGLQQKTLIHTAYSSKPLASFVGPHSCEVDSSASRVVDGLSTAIKNSQGTVLQDGGLYEVAKLPTEPLAIAHYLQRDLRDCVSKLGSVSDPNDIHSKSRGQLACETHYLPSPSELGSASFRADAANKHLATTPDEGSVVVDLRMRESWAAKAAREVRRSWGKREKGARSRQGVVPSAVVEKARRLVQVLTF